MKVSFTATNTARMMPISFVFLAMTLVCGIYIYYFRKFGSFILIQKNGKRKADLSKCYETIKGLQGEKTFPECVSHSKFSEYFSCFFEISPENANKKRTLIIGSFSPIGIEITKLYKHNKIEFAEIKGLNEINLTDMAIFDVFDSININKIILLDSRNENAFQKILSYAKKKRIKMYAAVERFSTIQSKYLYEIRVGKTMGPMKMEREALDPIYDHVFAHLVNHKTGEFSGNATEERIYASSMFAANFVFDNIERRSCQHKVELQCFRYSQGEVIRAMKLFERNQESELTNKGKEEKDLYNIISDIVNFPKRRANYATIFTIVHNNENEMNQLQKLCEVYKELVKRYEDIDIEFLLIFVKEEEYGRHFTSLSISDDIRNRLHVLYISKETMQTIYNKMSKEEAEDYLKRIGFKQAKTEFVFYNALDFFPSPAFIDILQQRELSKMSLVLQKPEYTNYFDISSYLSNNGTQQQIIDADSSSTLSGYQKRYEHGFDGFIGGHRDLLDALNGYGDYYSFGLDYSALKIPSLVNIFTGAVKLEEKQQNSKYKASSIYNNNVCNGYASRDIQSLNINRWGQSFDFDNPSNSTINKKGHLIFNTKKIFDENWNADEMSFYYFFDNNDYIDVINE